MQSEEQWEYIGSTKQHGRVYQMGDKFKYVDKWLEVLEDCVEQLNKTTAEVNRIENKLKEQGIDLFIKEAHEHLPKAKWSPKRSPVSTKGRQGNRV